MKVKSRSKIRKRAGAGERRGPPPPAPFAKSHASYFRFARLIRPHYTIWEPGTGYQAPFSPFRSALAISLFSDPLYELPVLFLWFHRPEKEHSEDSPYLKSFHLYSLPFSIEAICRQSGNKLKRALQALPVKQGLLTWFRLSWLCQNGYNVHWEDKKRPAFKIIFNLAISTLTTESQMSD